MVVVHQSIPAERRPVTVAHWEDLPASQPTAALVAGVDLVVVRFGEGDSERVSVLYGRCMHRGARLADGHVRGDDLICGLHDGDERLDDTGASATAPRELV